MMTPTRIVRFFGFVGLAVFLGLVVSSRSTIQAQNDDRLPPPPPIAADPSKPVIVSQATEEPAPAPKPEPAASAIEPLPLPAPAEAKPATPDVDKAGEPKDENPEAAPIPRAPEPKGLDAATIAPEPQPIGEAASAQALLSAGPADAGLAAVPDNPSPEQAPTVSDDPDKQARSFVERNRKEAEAQLKALNTEAAQLRSRLSKIESGIRRWQALADAMEKSEDAAAQTDLEPLPRAKATFRSRQKAAVIQSTPDEPVARKEYGREVGDHIFRSVPAAPEADPVTRAEFVPAPQPR